MIVKFIIIIFFVLIFSGFYHEVSCSSINIENATSAIITKIEGSGFLEIGRADSSGYISEFLEEMLVPSSFNKALFVDLKSGDSIRVSGSCKVELVLFSYGVNRFVVDSSNKWYSIPNLSETIAIKYDQPERTPLGSNRGGSKSKKLKILYPKEMDSVYEEGFAILWQNKTKTKRINVNLYNNSGKVKRNINKIELLCSKTVESNLFFLRDTVIQRNLFLDSSDISYIEIVEKKKSDYVIKDGHFIWKMDDAKSEKIKKSLSIFDGLDSHCKSYCRALIFYYNQLYGNAYFEIQECKRLIKPFGFKNKNYQFLEDRIVKVVGLELK